MGFNDFADDEDLCGQIIGYARHLFQIYAHLRMAGVGGVALHRNHC